MTWFSFGAARQPNQILESLQELRGRLQRELGDDLAALIVYGDIVRPNQFTPGESPVELLLVLELTSTDVLDRVGPCLGWAQKQFRMSAMTLTEKDLKQSCDVFPIQFLDMKENHRLLCGRDVLEPLEIADYHLRLRCEQELRNLTIRMRRTYLRYSGNSDKLRSEIVSSAKVFVRLLGVAILLKAGFSPDEPDAVITAAADQLGIFTEGLQAVWTNRASRQSFDKSTIDQFMTCLADACQMVDQLDSSIPKTNGGTA